MPNTEIIHFYAHGDKKTETHYELADAFGEDPGDPWVDCLHSDLLYLANEVELFYEINLDSGAITLIGIDTEYGTLGDTPDPTWTYSWEDDPDPDPEDDADVDVEMHPGHISVNVKDADTGEQKSALACKIAEEDINPDGTVSFPLSNDCPHDIND